MIEIIIAIILQVTTVLTGVDAEKAKAEQAAKDKGKTEQANSSTTTTDGGQGGWTGH